RKCAYACDHKQKNCHCGYLPHRNNPTCSRCHRRYSGWVRLLDGFFKLNPDVANILISTVRVFLQTAAKEFTNGFRRVDWERTPVRLSPEDSAKDLADRFALEDLAAGEQFIKDAAKRPDIRGAIRLLAFRLLRRHVGGSA